MSQPLPDWPRAHGLPLFMARLRGEPADFQVTEHLGWQPSGDGEHDYLFVEKTGVNTEWVAQQLARYAGVPVKDVGYAGLKDRHAVTQQWFSVPRWRSPDWHAWVMEGVEIMDVQRHLRKLRRGAHKANAFRILLGHTEVLDAVAVAQRLTVLRGCGVPNYFGEQRFGRHGSNLQLADDWAAGRRLPRHKRGLAISTVRAFLFNETLAVRVEAATWDQLIAGDTANLDGSASVFEVSAVDETLRSRCDAMDVHPAGLLAGEGSDTAHKHWQAALDAGRVEPGTRSFRLPVPDLAAEFTATGLLIRFTLGRGAYATAVLREFCRWA